MENPADVYTTGIQMSEKGNFDHNKYGCEDGSTVDGVCVVKLEDDDYSNNSHIVLRDSECDNVEFINNSIQDGFQSEILCSFECDAGLQSDLSMAQNSSLELESGISESGTHINFPDSPGTSFHEKIESFSSVEGLVPSLDEQLDNYLLSGFKSENKASSAGGNHAMEDEQRNVTEAICDIAKSFGLEDLLPDTFQVGGSKDELCVTITTDDLCDGDAENIASLSLGDFDKCPDLHSPASLNLAEHLGVDNYELSGLEMLSPKIKFENIIAPKLPFSLKGDQNKNYFNHKDLIANETDIKDSKIKTEVKNNCEVKELEINKNTTEIDADNSNYIHDKNVCNVTDDLDNDIPTVSISDAQIDSSFSDTDQNCPPAGTVLITRDKASKKMQIVLTLEQGQQIYDIDTESVDASQQPIDLDYPVSFSEKLPEVQDASLPESNMSPLEEIEVSSGIEEEKGADVTEGKEVLEQTKLIEYVSNVVPKVKKSKTWVCPIEDCGQVLDKECKLRVHMISHKGARPFKCQVEGCDWAFTTPYRLRRHADTHLGSKDYICDFEGCNRKFTTVYNLKTHKKRHKWPNSLTCPSKDCKMSFANRRKLELHLRVHKEVEAPYKCNLCGKQYYSANCIASHYRTHQYNADDFKCPFQGCGKIYDKICRLRQHIRHHTGDRPYTCPAEGCKWSFMSASKLTRHMRKHTGERKFVCTEPGCGKSFMRPEHLKGHIVIHSGDKPFHCPHENCNARFTAKSSLYVHVKKHCPSVLKVVYPCPIVSCIKKYNSKATLKQHLQKIHPESMKDGGTAISIAEKLELVMPVSVVNQTEDFEILELEELIADDPSSTLQLELFQNNQNSLNASSLNSGSVVVASSNLAVKSPKSSNSRAIQHNSSNSSKVSTKNHRTKATKSSKLLHVNNSGCARTDYCCNYVSKKPEVQTNFYYLNPNSSDSENLLNGTLTTDIKSSDVMLTSSIIYDNISEQLMKSHFSPDNSSNHSLYHDDSMLVSTSTFGQELIPASLLSDGVDSDESVLNHGSSGITFSEHNGVDTFSDSIHLHGLD